MNELRFFVLYIRFKGINGIRRCGYRVSGSDFRGIVESRYGFRRYKFINVV